MYTLVVYIPESHAEEVKGAMFGAGAGRIGDYQQCAWQVLGTGQFKPIEGSQPFVGRQGRVEKVAEFRVELVCDDASIKGVLGAMQAAHPYEEPAFHYWRVNELLPPGGDD